jgi:hypothetical protein
MCLSFSDRLLPGPLSIAASFWREYKTLSACSFEAFLPGPGSSGSLDGSSDGRPSSNEHAESVLYSLQKDAAIDSGPGSSLSEKERHIRQIIMQEASRRNTKEGEGVDPMEIVEDSNDDEVMSDQEHEDSIEPYEREEDDEEAEEKNESDQNDQPPEDEENLEVVENDDKKNDEDNEENKLRKNKKEEKVAEEKQSSERGKNDGKKDYKSEVNVCINTKEVNQLSSKIAVKSSAEISAK